MLRQAYYLDDLLILTNRNNSVKDHLLKLEMVLARLSTAGMRVNISKSKFFAEQIEYLGYWITRQGIQPIRYKVEAILNIKSPKTRKEETTTPVYRYSRLLSQHVVSQKWASSHVPLTSLTSSKVKFEWHSSHQQAFDKIKKVIGTHIQVFICHPDFNHICSFHLDIDASDHQLGAVIMQDKKPIAFYSQKLNTAQKRYTTTERELLSAIETCKVYKNILLGYH
jgi:hypothetical protein